MQNRYRAAIDAFSCCLITWNRQSDYGLSVIAIYISLPEVNTVNMPVMPLLNGVELFHELRLFMASTK